MEYERPAVIGRRDITAELVGICETSGVGNINPTWRRPEKTND